MWYCYVTESQLYDFAIKIFVTKKECYLFWTLYIWKPYQKLCNQITISPQSWFRVDICFMSPLLGTLLLYMPSYHFIIHLKYVFVNITQFGPKYMHSITPEIFTNDIWCFPRNLKVGKTKQKSFAPTKVKWRCFGTVKKITSIKIVYFYPSGSYSFFWPQLLSSTVNLPPKILKELQSFRHG